MTAAKRLTLIRVVGVGAAIVLAIAAVLDFTAWLTRPAVQAGALFVDGAVLPTDADNTAMTVSLDGEVRSDVAAILAMRALLQAPGTADASGSNKAAQQATVAALTVSPVNSLMWMTLGLLKAQINQPAGPALKTSYLTGPLPRDALVRRIRAVASSDAVNDEDVRLLGQTDVRTILIKYPRLEPALAATYRQATPDGKAFLLDATQTVDPRFSRLLRQYP